MVSMTFGSATSATSFGLFYSDCGIQMIATTFGLVEQRLP